MIDASVYNILGYVAGALTTVSFLPQVIKTFKSRSAKDISLGMYLIFSTGVFCWLLHGIGVNSMPIILANLVVFVLTMAMVVMKFKFK
jgi:MtN3 and saliva related transmembrane protein